MVNGLLCHGQVDYPGLSVVVKVGILWLLIDLKEAKKRLP